MCYSYANFLSLHGLWSDIRSFPHLVRSILLHSTCASGYTHENVLIRTATLIRLSHLHACTYRIMLLPLRDVEAPSVATGLGDVPQICDLLRSFFVVVSSCWYTYRDSRVHLLSKVWVGLMECKNFCEFAITRSLPLPTPDCLVYQCLCSLLSLSHLPRLRTQHMRLIWVTLCTGAKNWANSP